MPTMQWQGWKNALVVLLVGVLAGCAGPRAPAPVEDRSAGIRAWPGAVVATDPTKIPPGAENAGKPGYYTVRPGDTLIRISLDSGQNWRDVVRWNSLDNPNVIEVGQVLRISPPPGTMPVPVAAVSPASAPEVAVTKPVTPSSVASTPVPPVSAASAPLPPAAAASAASAPRPAVASVAPPASSLPPVPAADDDIPWGWPTDAGATVLAGFDEVKNKGLDIAGKAGDPVVAAADGRVVYAGAGLRGYGNLIILKHNNTYLTAYAHNQALLVKEDQTVRKGQKIAEMGSTDADRVKLHFEIRRQGRPVDPARYLPAR
ncbi:peptidoglycan DD-metalloendopeptidase family protein [Ramlibacter tataouinensis]|uniref:LysM domain-containing protein n=1 Tax=Ramlibacter tataouinensis (strain ATCC BAA-407 / DSM 14655 / LMG 21543 / TTB310) TaxID=365046 RepID=F5Y1V5_RAMTT|nr:peptidoglycan DD-metalloendopeptidase family protein [Ramlibacter tataouinensis]AEG93539.1 Conserved hypothetical protein [Ramlibacter tataouinensis TTB310]